MIEITWESLLLKVMLVSFLGMLLIVMHTVFNLTTKTIMESINVKIDDLSMLNLCDDNDVNEPNENHVNDIIAHIDVAR